MKPENIVLEDSQPGGRVYLVDFGGVQASAQLRLICLVQTMGYRALNPVLRDLKLVNLCSGLVQIQQSRQHAAACYGVLNG